MLMITVVTVYKSIMITNVLYDFSKDEKTLMMMVLGEVQLLKRTFVKF